MNELTHRRKAYIRLEPCTLKDLRPGDPYLNAEEINHPGNVEIKESLLNSLWDNPYTHSGALDMVYFRGSFPNAAPQEMEKEVYRVHFGFQVVPIDSEWKAQLDIAMNRILVRYVPTPLEELQDDVYVIHPLHFPLWNGHSNGSHLQSFLPLTYVVDANTFRQFIHGTGLKEVCVIKGDCLPAPLEFHDLDVQYRNLATEVPPKALFCFSDEYSIRFEKDGGLWKEEGIVGLWIRTTHEDATDLQEECQKRMEASGDIIRFAIFTIPVQE